jgi:hypothetical protein
VTRFATTVQGAESSKQRNKNELIPAPPQKDNNVWFKESLSADFACGAARTRPSARAKAIGPGVPAAFLPRADEVLE